MENNPAIHAPRQVFVVGSSRSGTTMMCRIIGNNAQVHFFRELHFFENTWLPKIPPEEINRDKARAMLCQLIGIQREGYLKVKDTSKYGPEAEAMLAEIGSAPLTPPLIYAEFLRQEAQANGAPIAVEQTPAYALYISELLALYPQARFVHMIRDPRSVLSSQRKKWRRRIYDKEGSGFTRFETVRAWANYHPWTTSKLWKAAVASVAAVQDNPRVMTVQFEDLADNSEAVIARVCAFLDIPFDPDMLLVPQIGSSYSAGNKQALGIDPNIAGSSWVGKLPKTDVTICDALCGDLMAQFGYETARDKSPLPFVIGSYIVMPFKLGFAILLNLGRTKNLLKSIGRRLTPARRSGEA